MLSCCMADAEEATAAELAVDVPTRATVEKVEKEPPAAETVENAEADPRVEDTQCEAAVRLPPPCELVEAVVRKQGSGLGLAIVTTDIGMQVTKIGRGSLRDYNSSVDEAMRISVHDLIVTVNGESGAQELAQRLNDDEAVTIQFVQLQRIPIRIEKSVSHMGMTLQFNEDSSTCLFVKEILEGAVQAHNATASPEEIVAPRDLIEQVNGKSGKVLEMLEELKSADAVDVVLLRIPAA